MARRAGATRSDGRERDRGGRSPTRPDVLARIAALGIRDKELLARAGVAPAFLSKARSGACTDAKASGSWAKVEATLLAVERERGKAPAPPIASPAPAATVAPAAASLSSGGAGPALEGVPPELAGFISELRAAKTPAELGALQRRVGELVALGPSRGGITTDVGRVLIQGITEQRHVVKAQREAEEKARSGEPVTIRIVYVNGWRERAEGEAEAARAALVKAATAAGALNS